MAKLVFLFGIVCVFSLIPTSFAFVNVLSLLSSFAPALTGSVDITSSYGTYGDNNTVEDQIEFHTAIANGIFDFIVALVQKKAEVIILLKRAILNFAIRAVGYLKFFILSNPEFVQNLINSGAELLKLILTNKPHFAVPHIVKIISEAMPSTNYGAPPPPYVSPYGTH